MRCQRTAQLAAYAVLLVTAASCGSQTGGPGGTGADPKAVALDGDWRLTAASQAGTALALDATHPITLHLDGNEPSGTSACNSYSGTMVTDADTVTFSNLGGTEMACMPAAVMDLEQAYLTALQGVDQAVRDGDRLTLTGTDVELSFTTVPAVPDADLVGTDWRLDTVVDGDTASSVSDRPSTLRLGPNGRLTGSTGCNDFGATWSLAGAVVSVKDFSMTLVGCSGAIGRQEKAVLAALGDGSTATVTGDALTVAGPSGHGLVYRAQ
jgi:heat shock protein HslJ